MIHGSPLNIYANDGGQLQVAFDGSATGEFSPPALAPANAGLNVAVAARRQPNRAFTVYGFLGAPFTPTSAAGPAVTGDGSAANPWTLTTDYRARRSRGATDRRRREHVSYVNGTTDVSVQYSVVNLSATTSTCTCRLYEAADLFVAGDDSGAGFLDPGPPRQVGGVNQAAGGSARLVEQTPPWSHYQEGRAADVFAVVAATPTWRPRASTTRSSRPSSTTASARSGTSRPWRSTPTGPRPSR